MTLRKQLQSRRPVTRHGALAVIVMLAAILALVSPAHPSQPASGPDDHPPVTVDLYWTIGAGALMFVLVVAGVALTIKGLRSDLREKRRSYRRRSRRIDARGSSHAP